MDYNARYILVYEGRTWRVRANGTDSDIQEILNLGLNQRYFTIPSKDVAEFVKTHFCMVLHPTKKLIYLSGMLFAPPKGWKRTPYLSMLLEVKRKGPDKKGGV
jgi:hypothetical protein